MQALKALITEQIAENGPISLATYWDHCLYHLEYGYYNKSEPIFGPDGDFITASSCPLYAQTIIGYLQDQPKLSKPYDILELGAGNASFCAHTIDYTKDCQHYYIYEPSQKLRDKQRYILQAQLPQNQFKKVTFLDKLCPLSNVLVILNEVIDALPVKSYLRLGKHVYERLISLDTQQNFCWHNSDEPRTLPKQLLPEQTLGDCIFEINFEQEKLLRWLYPYLCGAQILIADYGTTRNYFQPQGRIKCFYQHQQHDNIFSNPGQQDITCDVNFDHLLTSAQNIGYQVADYDTQASFLIHAGLLKHFGNNLPTKLHLQKTQELDLLTSPNKMGECFKIAHLIKE